MMHRPSSSRTCLHPLAGLAALALAAAGGCAVDDEPELATTAAPLGTPPVTGTLDGWTVGSQVEPGATPGTMRASATFDDGGLGGVRSGGICLVADLDLGACTSDAECSAAAAARGLPVTFGPEGWYHYCARAGASHGAHSPPLRCWSRPAAQGQLCAVGPGARPGEVRSVERAVTDLAHLDDVPRAWTGIACLAGGLGPDGAVVGDPAGCARHTRYLYVIDDPRWASGH